VLSILHQGPRSSRSKGDLSYRQHTPAGCQSVQVYAQAQNLYSTRVCLCFRLCSFHVMPRDPVNTVTGSLGNLDASSRALKPVADQYPSFASPPYHACNQDTSATIGHHEICLPKNPLRRSAVSLLAQLANCLTDQTLDLFTCDS
jgi:hypothetical protein